MGLSMKTAKTIGVVHRFMVHMMWCLVLLAPFPVTAAGDQIDMRNRDDLTHIFAQHDVTGAFVLLDVATGQHFVVNENFAAPRRIPASTFKIVNSLIALETGAVQDTDEIIPYGGGRVPVAAWAKDMSMRDAIVVSNVPIYQELARRVGLRNYRKWLSKLSYGNGSVGTDVETFWLKGPLQISPVEQSEILAKLAQGQLPMSKRNQSLVRDILKAGVQGDSLLFAKSGWTISPDPDIGWYVGWVKDAGQLYTFALVMEIHDKRDAALRKELALEFLQAFGVYR